MVHLGRFMYRLVKTFVLVLGPVLVPELKVSAWCIRIGMAEGVLLHDHVD